MSCANPMQRAVDRMATILQSAESPQGAGLPPQFLEELHKKMAQAFARDVPAAAIRRLYTQDVLAYFVRTKQPPPANFELIVMWAMLSHPACRDQDTTHCVSKLLG